MNPLPKYILAILLLSASTTHARTLSASVPVLPGAEAGSRAAIFSWEFLSESGAEPITGRYACGSYWVAPASGDRSVVLKSLSATSGGVPQPNHITLDADPTTDRRGLLNNAKNYGNYHADEAIQTKLPATFTTNTAISLVAALQRNESESPGGGTPAIQGERVDAYCVVTVLSAPPPDQGLNSIRPNITGATKEFLTWDDFDLSRLGNFSGFAKLTPDAIEVISTRWRHSTEIFGFTTAAAGSRYTYSEGGRAFRAGVCHDEYGAGMNSAIQNDILALFNPHNSLAEKKPALASILSFALDLFHARYNSGNNERVGFTSGAGQHAGKYAPMLLLAALSRSTEKANTLRTVSVHNHNPEDPLQRGPQEVRQIRRGVTGVVLWGDSLPYTFSNLTSMPNGSPSRRYWVDLLASKHYRGQTVYGNPNIGEKTAGDPYGYIDGPPNFPGYAYIAIGSVATQGLAAIMVLMPSVRDIVNTDAPIEFADRFVRHGTWAAPDPIAPPPPDISENVWNPGTFPGESFGKSWGPRPDDVRFGIEDGTGRGRFNAGDKHGQPMYSSYLPSLVRTHWETILLLYDGERFESNFVPVTGTAKPDIVIVNGLAHITHPHPLATMHYTTDGSTPSASSPVYTNPVPVGASTSIRAMATTPGKTPSAVRTYGVRSEADKPPSNAKILVN